MKKLSLLLVLFLCFTACSEQESNLSITGTVKDLKEGTLYLQKIEDTTVVSIDSATIRGKSNFTFEVDLESPQVLYLKLDKLDGNEYDDRFLFFAEPGEMTVETTLENFDTDAVIEGSVNQEKLTEYQKMMARFNDQNLDLIKSNLEAQKTGNEDSITAINEKMDKLLKRRYLYTVNYALNNKEYEIAPYLAVSEIYNANLKYLDTIHKSLTPEVKDSKYGKSLETFIKDRREMENETAATVTD